MADNLERRLSELVAPEEAYARSTNVELDYQNPEGIPSYKFTAKGLRLLEDVLDSCRGQRRDRAWSVIGPYGSGKSTFALFLLQLLTGAESPWLRRCLVELGPASPSLAQRVHGEIEAEGTRYLPVVLQGARVSLDLALCRALKQAATGAGREPSWVSDSFLASLDLTLETLEAGLPDSLGTVELYRQASQLARVAGYRGLLVVIDEFGKFLERAAWQGDLPDLITAQYLAELASGQEDPQVLFLVLVHQGFQHYASSLTQRQWVEWAKIQGRFRQVDFNEDPDHLYGIIAAALGKGTEAGWEPGYQIEAWSRRVWDQVKDLPEFDREASSEFWPELLPQVYPFHPLALYALPRLSARLGQNERSLFGFLASEDPLGLKRFLQTTPVEEEELPSLTLDYLFDYFFSGSRFGALPPDVQRRVSEAEAALDRLGDRPALEVRLLKTLGAMEVLRAGPSLPASEAVLTAALGADTEDARSALREALDILVTRKIIVFRKFSGEYRIWQGSDFDFDGALSRTREEVQEGFHLGLALEEELSSRPLLAQRHSLETGTNRFFSVAFLDPQEAGKLEGDELVRRMIETNADGLLLYLLPKSQKEVEETQAWAAALDDPRLIVVVPKEPVPVASLLQDLISLRRIRSAYPELQDDPVALKELSARIEGAQELLRQTLDSATEPSPEGPAWYWQGKLQDVTRRRHLIALLSTVCDAVYSFTPRLRNELVNRRQLSSAVVVAVKKIIGGLLTEQGEPGLGFSGNGPEVSIFRAVFETPGIYRDGGQGCYVLCPPNADADPGFRAVWQVIEGFLRSCDNSAQGVSQLYQRLAAPPYGLRPGLVPLLTWAVLVYHRENLCLYENGTYVREWAPEIFDRFVKDPDAFALRWLVLSGPVGQLLHRLNDAIPNAPPLTESEAGVPLSGFLQNLYHWYHRLPDYAKHTLKLDPEIIEVRRVLATAVDPVDLLQAKTPQALGLSPTSSLPELLRRRKAMTRYVNGFTKSVLDMASAYSTLVNQMVGHMAAAFGTQPNISDLRRLFQGIPEDILEHVRDSAAKAFFIRAQETQTGDIQWLESLGAALANQAPRFWMDHHFEEFADKVSLAAMAVADARRRAYARGGGDGEMRRISLERPGGGLVETVLAEGDLRGELGDVAKTLLRFLEVSSPGIPSDYKQRVLAGALYLVSGDTEEGDRT